MLSKKDQRLKKKCVEHWFENLMMLQLNHLSKNSSLIQDINISGCDCAFCNEYNVRYDICYGCPISESTGRSSCYRTPYYYVRSTMHNQESTYKELFEAITNEINFLMNLN